MKKDVLISILGFQYDITETEPIEIVTTGTYYLRNNKHYIIYDEIIELENTINNTIKITDTKINTTIEIKKKGAINVHMIFDKNQKNISHYNTPYGEFQIGINTNKIYFKQETNNIHVKINYLLDLNNSRLSECLIEINIKDL